MANEDPNKPQDASASVAEAHGLLTKIREEMTHPDLDVAIEKLEYALSVLTTKTSGML